MRVYLSSTLKDLESERQAVRDVLGRGQCSVVDSYVAHTDCVRTSCVADVEGCDLCIVIVGMRYGTIAPGHDRSITQMEHEAARRHGITTWVFIKDEDSIKPRFHDAVSKEHPRERIEGFRQALASTPVRCHSSPRPS